MRSLTSSLDTRHELEQAVLYQQIQKKRALFCLQNLVDAFLDLEAPVNWPIISQGWVGEFHSIE